MKLHMDTFRRLRFGVDLIAGLPEYDRRRADAHDGLIVLANSTGDAGDRFAAGLALIVALDGWNRIAIAHKGLSWNEDGSPIGRDHYAGPLFLDMGKALQGMLAMDSRSALLSYKADEFILDTLHTNGFSEDETA